ncbi:elongation factor P hydroxylase [Arhodomonas sp. AD133]|uniref:elongation factor P hydroxylase n=1 Tax=Arhodomonas sp. AD133 TaxID=3415009 RepID=UPI003EBB832A
MSHAVQTSPSPHGGGPVHDAADLIALFDDEFAERENTRLVRGGDEPLYLPADDECPHHRVIFAHGFFASALHEIAHWCIAGAARRRLVDYGYWYQGDGRDAATQALFERVEASPQALEWVFSLAAGSPFRVSFDNLDGAAGDIEAFRRRVHARLAAYLSHGLPPRARRFADRLEAFYGGRVVLPDHLPRY